MQNGTVLFVSHDTAAVKGLCNHAIWLNQGYVHEQGTPKEVCEHYLQAFYEAQQVAEAGATTATDAVAAQEISPATPPPLQMPSPAVAPNRRPQSDQRLAFLNTSNLRNDLRLFEFSPDAPSFGAGGSKVIRVQLCDSDGRPLTWAVGGEDVALEVDALALQRLESPIVGFVVKDRLGQALFGDNTYVAYEHQPAQCEAGQTLRAAFHFQMPRLPVGDYSITIAIADGTQQDHVQHQWIFDALTFRSESTSASGGLVGIPMTRIQLNAGAATPATST